MYSFKNTYNNIFSRLVALLLISVLHLSSITGSIPSLLSQTVPSSDISTLNGEVSTDSCIGTIDNTSTSISFNDEIQLTNAALKNSTSNSFPYSYLVTGEKLELEKEKQLPFVLQSGSDYALHVSFSHKDVIEKSVLTNFILSRLRTVVLLH